MSLKIVVSAGLLATLAVPAIAQQTVWGQCGGIGWTGVTSCVSGNVCTYQNDYYSQCIPGTAATTAATTAKTTTTSSKTTSKSATTSVTSVTTSKAATTTATAGGSTCTVSAYTQVSSAVASCTNILLKSIAVPAGKQLDLGALKASTTVTFSGTTTFGYYSWTSPLILIGGTDFHITAASGAIIDGNGPAWWDGQGDGGNPKPGHFIQVKSAGTKSLIEKLSIKNYPNHCFTMSGTGLTVQNVNVDNSAGSAPNSLSGGKAAAHNTDGFNVKGQNFLFQDITVTNQDDCIAVSAGAGNVTAKRITCNGSHGLSVGSIGSDTTVNGVTFMDSTVTGASNGCRIKTVSGATGSTVSNIVYQNIKLSGITDVGIMIDQAYGGTEGQPTNGVKISNVKFINVTGTVTSAAQDYFISCGSGSCSSITFSGVKVTGGKGDSCNFGGLC
ncbi:Polygalacturonase [Dactylellina cionopaga]|nr:Polygalacturonase [Dactylellina cionopaga]